MTDSAHSTAVDERRRQEILRRTRMGLQEDLDDLRQTLGARLEHFESRLQRTAKHLPLWLDLPTDSLRAPFRLPSPAVLENTLIGPRTVAMVASDVEDFLFEWLGDQESIPAWQKRDDADATSQLADDLDQLAAFIDDCQQALFALGDDGPLQLEQILESIVFELETRRETDVEALESMIQDGDVEPGRNARAEIAELWEEQRRRVDELQRVWDDILNLHHEGVRITLDGLEELADLALQARTGIEGAQILDAPPSASAPEPPAPTPADALEDAPIPDEDTDRLTDRAIDNGSADDDKAGDLGSTATEGTNPFLRSPSEVSDISEVSDATDEDREFTDAGPTAPMLDDVAARLAEQSAATDDGAPDSEKADEPDEIDDTDAPDEADETDDADEKTEPPENAEKQGDENASNTPGPGENLDLFAVTIPDSASPAPAPQAVQTEATETSPDSDTSADKGSPDSHEPADDAPERPGDTLVSDDTPDQSRDDADQAGDGDSLPTDIDAGAATEKPVTEAQAAETPTAEPAPQQMPSRRLTHTPRAAKPTPADAQPQATGSADDLLRVRTYRIRDGWETVGIDEIAATLGPSGLFVAAFLIMGLLSLVGLSPNPMSFGVWTLPATYGAMALLVILPLMSKWRPMWRGTKFRIIRWGDVEDEVDVRISADDRFILDRTGWAIAELESIKICRWEADRGATKGWLVTIKPPYHSPIYMVTIAEDLTLWEQAPDPIEDVPSDSWQLPPVEFDLICGRLEQLIP